MRDFHHIVHYAQEWNLRPEGRRIRQTPTLIPELDRRVHNEIHAVCPAIPPLGHYALRLIESRFVPGRTTLESMDNLMFAIEESANHPKAHRIERDLAGLAIEAIDLQRPWIADGERHLRLVI